VQIYSYVGTIIPISRHYVKNNVSLSSQSFVFIILVVGKVGVCTTIWVTIGGVGFGSIPL
jgi:hypothetical protein